jgi:FMN phosphatase YigB (HAD superfamily)
VLGVVTDAPRLRAWNRLAAMNLTPYFDFVVTVAEAKRRKPHSAPFTLALRKLASRGIKPSETLFVGDSPGRDMAGAQRAGMRACLARYGARGWRTSAWRSVKHHFVEASEHASERHARRVKSRVKPDFVIDEASELAEIVG